MFLRFCDVGTAAGGQNGEAVGGVAGDGAWVRWAELALSPAYNEESILEDECTAVPVNQLGECPSSATGKRAFLKASKSSSLSFPRYSEIELPSISQRHVDTSYVR
jgi:hypothetical protein